MSEHHDAVLYEIQKTVGETVNRSRRIAGPLPYDLATMHYGLGLIVCRGFLTREMEKFIDFPKPGKFPKRMKNITGRPVIREIDFWHYKFDPQSEWYGWQELTNFFRLADSFTHRQGSLNGQDAKVKAFRKQLDTGEIKNRKKKAVDPYFDVDGEGRLVLQREALNRFTSLTGELVHWVEKYLRRRKKR
ncbi:MAG: hypothetical protein NPINA01_20840 [Nitrospinaceae bacterium]|nr:MAG: hypothetical protein NPINA01_20840 [Nitrospinaceae bacterium]